MQNRPPSSDFDDYSLKWRPPSRERGGCLNLWLAVSTVFSLFSAFVLCQALTVVSGRVLRPGATFGLVILGGLIIGGMVCLWGIWNWKRWGVYGIAAASIISPLAEILFGRPSLTDFVAPIVQIGVLYFLVKDKWDHFD